MSSEPESAELEALVVGLASPDIASRQRSARELFRRGIALARPATDAWLADSKFAASMVLDASQFPVTTVGIAVTPENFDRIRAANGSPRLAEVPPDQDAKEFELHFAQGVRLDILTTREPGGTGAIARYLQKSGEGIQQAELLARNVDAATEILRAGFGVQPIYPATRAGADGSRVNFFLVPLTGKGPEKGKVLIELVELASDK
ncbi:MAG TPA: hypothetical protein VGH17_05340 [Candidatus Acidoferrales bacterium]|jgi:hypothetical protein